MNRVLELRCGSVDYFGIGAINRFEHIMEQYRKRGIRRVGIVTGRSSYRLSGAWRVVKPVIEEKHLEYLHFDAITPNPTVDQIDEAVHLLKEVEPQLIIGIGGGSSLDASKVVAVLLRNRGITARDIYTGRFTPFEALPILSINLTHGTGSEVDRYAVATIPEERNKSGAAADCMYPEYAIDDPELMLSLPDKEVLYTSLDALNHLVEAATTKLSSPYTVMLAKEGIALIHKWLPRAIEDRQDIEARYWLLYASILGGIAIDCAVVHITHPLEHTLSAFRPGLEHGLGLTILLPSVIKVIYPAVAETLSGILRPITGTLKGTPDEAEGIAQSLREWIESLGVSQRLRDVGFTDDDIPELVRYVRRSQGESGSLSLAPVKVTDEMIKEIYRESL